MSTDKIFYLCDGNKQECKKRNCYKTTGASVGVCRHTTDINHAMNFKEEIPRNQNKSFWEKEGEKSEDN